MAIGWRCPGCDGGPYDMGSDAADHVRDCVLVDGAGRPRDQSRYATVVIVMPLEDAENYVEDVMAGGQAVYFAGHLPGITHDAVAAGADPSSWPEEG